MGGSLGGGSLAARSLAGCSEGKGRGGWDPTMPPPAGSHGAAAAARAAAGMRVGPLGRRFTARDFEAALSMEAESTAVVHPTMRLQAARSWASRKQATMKQVCGHKPLRKA